MQNSKNLDRDYEEQPPEEENIEKIYGDYLIARTGLYKEKEGDELTYAEIKEMEEILEEIEEEFFPKKQITVKLYSETHKNLKIRSASEDKTIDKLATSIVEKRMNQLDIVKYVEDKFNEIDNTRDYFYGIDIGNEIEESIREAYDTISEYLEEKGERAKPRKRINVKVYLRTHKKLGVIGAIENKSLGDVVSCILEEEFGDVDIGEERDKIKDRAKKLLIVELEKRDDISEQLLNILKKVPPETIIRILKNLELMNTLKKI